MKILTRLVIICAIFGCAGFAMGCAEKGPFEKSGERMDEVIDNAKEGDPLLKRKGTAEKIGEAIDETVDDVKGSNR